MLRVSRCQYNKLLALRLVFVTLLLLGFWPNINFRAINIFLLPKANRMLYSHSHQEQSFDYFASFLRNVLRGENQYKALVQPVIDEAKLLARQEKDVFKVANQGFEVIVYLAQKDPEFFTCLNRELSEKDYQYILDLITTQREVISA